MPVGLEKATTPGTFLARPGVYRVSWADGSVRINDPRGRNHLSGLTSGECELVVRPAQPGDAISRELAAQPPAAHPATEAECSGSAP